MALSRCFHTLQLRVTACPLTEVWGSAFVPNESDMPPLGIELRVERPPDHLVIYWFQPRPRFVTGTQIRIT